MLQWLVLLEDASELLQITVVVLQRERASRLRQSYYGHSHRRNSLSDFKGKRETVDIPQREARVLGDYLVLAFQDKGTGRGPWKATFVVQSFLDKLEICVVVLNRIIS